MTVQTLSVEMPVGQIVLEHPQTRPLLEKLRIDYACSGGQSLRRTAQAAGIDPESILLQLESTLTRNPAAETAADMSLSDLCVWLVNVHHARLKEQIPNLDCLLCRLRRSGQKPYTLILKRLNDAFQSLTADLLTHTSRQEQTLFPLIARLETAAAGRDEPPGIPDIEDAVAFQMRLHASSAATLSAIRDLTEDYSWPNSDFEPFESLFSDLAVFEDNLHEHIHYENNLLFPKTLKLCQLLQPS